MPKCKICEETDATKFYKSNLGTCKECVKARTRQYREDNIEKVREYDRNRPNAETRIRKNTERIEQYKESNPKKYDDYNKAKREWRRRNRHKLNAQQQAERALFKGVINKPLSCERCEETENIQGHHPDYNKPLEVIWLCPKCHGLEHKRLNEIKRGER